MSRFPRWARPGTFLRSVSILAGGAALGQLVAVAVSPVLSRLFSAESFGVLAVYTAVLGVTTAVGSLRLEQAIGLPRSRQAGFNVLWLALISATVTSLVIGAVMIMAPGLLFGGDTNIPALVAGLFPVGVFLSSAYQAASVWALRARAFRPIAATRITQAIAGAGAQVVAGICGFGAVGLVAGHIIGQSGGLGALVTTTVRKRRLRTPRKRELRAAIARYRHFPLLATPAALLNSVSMQLPVFLMAPAFGAAVIGQYFLATRITLAPLTLIGGSIGQVFYADATAIGRSNPRRLIRLILATSGKSFLIGLIPGALIAIFASSLFPLIFGDEWTMAGNISQALSIMLIANFAMSPVTQIFLILEKQTFSVVINAARLIIAAAAIMLPITLGYTPELTVFVYSCAMAGFYLSTLATAVALLYRMQMSARPDRSER